MGGVTVIKPDQRSANTAQTPNMVRQAGIARDTCGSRGLWIGYVSSPPGPSGAHHHGDAESGIYVLSGRVRMYFGDRLEQSVDAEAGDFIFVPPNADPRRGERRVGAGRAHRRAQHRRIPRRQRRRPEGIMLAGSIMAVVSEDSRE